MGKTTITNQISNTHPLSVNGIPWSIYYNGGGIFRIPAYSTRSSDMTAVGVAAPEMHMQGWNLASNGGTNASVLWNPTSYGGYRFGNHIFNGSIDFTKPIWFCYRGSAYFNTAQTALRMQFGGFPYNSTTVGNFPATAVGESAMGLLMVGGKIYIETASNVTGSMQRFQTDTGLTYSPGACCPFFDFKLYSSGTGKMILYSNNVKAFEANNIGPISAASGGYGRLAFSVSSTSGVTEYNSGCTISDGAITILVEI